MFTFIKKFGEYILSSNLHNLIFIYLGDIYLIYIKFYKDESCILLKNLGIDFLYKVYYFNQFKLLLYYFLDITFLQSVLREKRYGCFQAIIL